MSSASLRQRLYPVSIGRLCTFLVSSTIVLYPAAAEEKIYWTDTHGEVRRANLDGSQVEILIENGAYRPYTIAIDPLQRKMYWTDWHLGGTRRANLDGTNAEIVMPDHAPSRLELATGIGKMYWLNRGTSHRLQRANLDGTDIEDVITGIGWAFGLAIDEVAGKVYWTERDLETIRRANLDGSDVELFLHRAGKELDNIAVDPVGAKVYWDERVGVNGGMVRANLDGTGIEDLGPFAGWEISIDAEAGKIYWGGGGYIARANLNGSNVENFYIQVSGCSARGIALDLQDNRLFWVCYAGGTVNSADMNGANRVVLFKRVLDGPLAISLDRFDGKMYFTDRGSYVNGPPSQILRANLDGSGIENLISEWSTSLPGLVVDPPTGKMYFTNTNQEDYGFSYLMRADMDGSSVEYFYYQPQLIQAQGIDFDPIAERLFYGDSYYFEPVPNGHISSVNTNGGSEQEIAAAHSPAGVAVDITASKVYWANGGDWYTGELGSIQRANYDGSNVEDLVTADIAAPRGIALDVLRGKMYWAEQGDSDFNIDAGIWRADLDGANKELLVTDGLTSPYGIALDLQEPQIGACCSTIGGQQETCEVVQSVECGTLGGLFLGHLSNCSEEIGACCLPGVNGALPDSCMETDRNCCEFRGGTFLGVVSTCSEFNGACCADGNGDGIRDSCTVANLACCETQDGSYHGTGTACHAARGACCLDGDGDGLLETCTLMDDDCCTTQGGSFQGDASMCSGVIGACCLDGDGDSIFDSCTFIDRDCCDAQGGFFRGDGIACSAMTEACCLDGNGDGRFDACVMISPACCAAQDGISLGPLLVCPGYTESGSEAECDTLIPAVSEWGLVILTLLLLVGIKVFCIYTARGIRLPRAAP